MLPNYIASTAPAPPLPAPTTITEWGLSGVVALVILKEGWAIVHKIWDNFVTKDQAESALLLQKEKDESELMKMLIQDLMSSRQQQHDDLRQVSEAIAAQTKELANLAVAVNRAIDKIS